MKFFSRSLVVAVSVASVMLVWLPAHADESSQNKCMQFCVNTRVDCITAHNNANNCINAELACREVCRRNN